MWNSPDHWNFLKLSPRPPLKVFPLVSQPSGRRRRPENVSVFPLTKAENLVLPQFEIIPLVSQPSETGGIISRNTSDTKFAKCDPIESIFNRF